ncbi:MAG: DUF1592 domain-containing protein [Pirellulaceae bacterium]
MRLRFVESARRLGSTWSAVACFCLALAFALRSPAADGEFANRAAPLLERYCTDCHGEALQEAKLNLQTLAADPKYATQFKAWRQVVSMLAQQRMPPEDAPPMKDSERRELAELVRSELHRAAVEHADDPGPVLLRRLTAAEYQYTIQDLTGVPLDLDSEVVGDAVGGEGFTNVGAVQFVQDSTLEYYLAAAKRVADHAVLGAGPLRFHIAPGDAGFELAALARINDLYRQHGFRAAAGEGGEPFGMQRYAQAMFVAWRFQHREALGLSEATLESLAAEDGVSPRFAAHIHSVLSDTPRQAPTSHIVNAWRELPKPSAPNEKLQTKVRAKCDEVSKLLQSWQNRLGENPDAKEEPRILAVEEFDVSRSQSFRMGIQWPKGTQTAHLTLRVEPVDDDGRSPLAVVWRNPEVQFNVPDVPLEDPRPLKDVLREDDVRLLKFGGREGVGPGDFLTIGTEPVTFRLPIPPGAKSAILTVDAKLDVPPDVHCVVCCFMTQHEETDQGDSVTGLIANPRAEAFEAWKSGVLEFATLLPQVSHREPAPSDRDPIPPPFDPSYNNPERNLFHVRVRYHRDDHFLVEKMLSDDARRQLDRAWIDLLGCFEYHETCLKFYADKHQLDLRGQGVAQLDAAAIAALPVEHQPYVRRLQREHHDIQRAMQAARPGHVSDAIEFAARAWRRPLDQQEVAELRAYYDHLKSKFELSHRQAMRALLTRILTSPEFLYLAQRDAAPESPSDPAAHTPTDTTADTPADTENRSPQTAVVPLSDWQVAARLSYFLWSSLPDDELRRAAAAGELRTAEQVRAQARRMLRDPKARRLAAEFFAQWLGFYQFDRYRGVDPERFPEFTDRVKQAMHAEAVALLEHIVREDRPVREILLADYGFLNRELAAHYGIDVELPPGTALERVEALDRFDRGGVLGLGAVLTSTSAPLRTSPVKRGDWILRRLLGTPVPPPPADAGSIPADDLVADGLTARQRLESHRRQASCNNCHARIDPLGFALEPFDAVGRRRERMGDGSPVEASGVLHDGTKIDGPRGLRAYLARNEDLFFRTLCTKLVGYALTRGESIHDVLLIDQMLADCRTDGRFSSLVERIVGSRQFRYRRGGAIAPAPAGGASETEGAFPPQGGNP